MKHGLGTWSWDKVKDLEPEALNSMRSIGVVLWAVHREGYFSTGLHESSRIYVVD